MVNVVPAAIVLAALLVPCPGQAAKTAAHAAAPASLAVGKSFLDLSTTYSEEPSYSVPATFPGPLVAEPRRKPEPAAMLLACLGLIFYLGRRRQKALGAAAG